MAFPHWRLFMSEAGVAPAHRLYRKKGIAMPPRTTSPRRRGAHLRPDDGKFVPLCTNRVKAIGRQLRAGPESAATNRPATAYSGLCAFAAAHAANLFTVLMLAW
jgi:hypothetical protein